MTKEKNRTNGKRRVNIKLKETIIHPRKHKVQPKLKPAKQRVNTSAKPQVKSSVKSPLLAKQPKTKSPGGRGLGKAGARRLGQLLKRAIQDKTNVTGKEKEPLPCKYCYSRRVTGYCVALMFKLELKFSDSSVTYLSRPTVDS